MPPLPLRTSVAASSDAYWLADSLGVISETALGGLYELYEPTLDNGPDAVDPEAEETASGSFALRTREPDATEADMGRFRSDVADPAFDVGFADMGRTGRDATSPREPSTSRSTLSLSFGASQSGR